METKSKIPALRFKGFTDAWEERKLGDIFKKDTQKNKDLEFHSDSVISVAKMKLSPPSAKSSDEYMKTYNKIRKGNVAFEGHTNDEFPHGRFVLNDCQDGIVSHIYDVYSAVDEYNNEFMKRYINNPDVMRKILINATSSARMMKSLNSIEFLKQSILLPILSEQQKIGKFFYQLDNTISLHQRKCEQTKELKKTMLQKMFPKKGERIPEIRFPEFTDEWEEKKLGEMLTERNVQQVPKEDAPLVSFTVENGVTPKTDRYDREFLVRTGDKKYKYTTFDDIVYNPANLKFGAIARNKFGDAVFSPIYVTLVADKEKVLPIFIERIVTNGNFIQESLRYQEGTVYERMSVKVPDFLSMKISIPSLPEQEAIGAYFQTLDQDIAQIEKKLADLKELKKTLLRQLFV